MWITIPTSQGWNMPPLLCARWIGAGVPNVPPPLNQTVCPGSLIYNPRKATRNGTTSQQTVTQNPVTKFNPQISIDPGPKETGLIPGIDNTTLFFIAGGIFIIFMLIK